VFENKVLRRIFGFDEGEWEENGENCEEFLDVHTYSTADTVVRSQKIRHKPNFCVSVN